MLLHVQQLPNSNSSLTTKLLLTLQSNVTQGRPSKQKFIAFGSKGDFCRRIEMETRLSQLHSPDAKEREIRKYSKIESQHLRLRRTKIKLEDFRTVKVIGKGAFGEV